MHCLCNTHCTNILNDAITFLRFLPIHTRCRLIKAVEEISKQLIYDEERKYGKIPTRIYLLYIKSCGWIVVSIFCLTALGWQALRICTDIWLQNWTDMDLLTDDSSEVGHLVHKYRYM